MRTGGRSVICVTFSFAEFPTMLLGMDTWWSTVDVTLSRHLHTLSMHLDLCVEPQYTDASEEWGSLSACVVFVRCARLFWDLKIKQQARNTRCCRSQKQPCQWRRQRQIFGACEAGQQRIIELGQTDPPSCQRPDCKKTKFNVSYPQLFTWSCFFFVLFCIFLFLFFFFLSWRGPKWNWTDVELLIFFFSPLYKHLN